VRAYDAYNNPLRAVRADRSDRTGITTHCKRSLAVRVVFLFSHDFQQYNGPHHYYYNVIARATLVFPADYCYYYTEDDRSRDFR